MTYQKADLLGINGDGIAEYLRQDDRIFLVELGSGKELQTPSEFGPAHEISLDAFDWGLAEYLEASIDEKGEWRVMTSIAKEALSGD